MQVKIPVHVVPRAHVDYDAEARQILGFPLVVRNQNGETLTLEPITAARLIALELISSPFFLHPDSCDPADVARALVVLTADRADVAALTADPALLSARADALLERFGSAIADRYREIAEWVRAVPFYGFNMGPDAPPQHGEFWFDGAFVGSVVAPAARLMATNVDRVLWEIPLCLVGHAVVQYAASLGVKGIERKPDREALKRIMAEAEARERAGLLHPWQYADPDCFPLTDVQAAANPALIEIFAKIRAEYDRTRRPVDPADYPIPSAGEAERTGSIREFPGAQAAQAAGASPCTDAVSAAQSAPSTDGPRFAGVNDGFICPIGPVGPISSIIQAFPCGFAVADPSVARDAHPTLTVQACASEAGRTAAVQGLPCCLPGMRAESISIYGK